MKRLFFVLIALSFSATLHAKEESGKFSGEGALGYTSTATYANTASDSLLAKLSLNYKKNRFGNAFLAEIVKAETENANGVKSKSADKLYFADKLSYDFNDSWYALANFTHEDDKLSNLAYKRTYTVGIGYRALKTDKTSLEFELGGGSYTNKLRDSGRKESGGAGRFYQKFAHQLSPTTKISQSYLAETAEDIVNSTLDLGVEVMMNKKITLKVGQQYKHRSKTPAGSKKYERISNVSLVYSF